MKNCVLSALILALGACAAAPITTPPVSMTFSDPALESRVDTFDIVEVRTVTGQFASRETVEGAACEVFGTGFSATFQSPAVLNMPLFRGRTSDARITCRATLDGQTLTDARTLEVRNLSAPENEGITISTGTSGTSVGAVFSIRDRSKDRFDYPRSTVLVLR